MAHRERDGLPAPARLESATVWDGSGTLFGIFRLKLVKVKVVLPSPEPVLVLSSLPT